MSCAAPGPALALDTTAHTFRTLRSFSILLLMEMADEAIVILLDEMVTSIEIHRIEMTSLSQRTAPGVQSRRVPL